MVKSLLGIALVYAVARLLADESEGADMYCQHLREMEQINRDAVRATPLKSGDRMRLVYEGEWRYGCQPLVSQSFWLVVALTAIVGLLSLVSPARRRFAPSRASALAVVGKFVAFVLAAGALVWVYEGTNRAKLLTYF